MSCAFNVLRSRAFLYFCFARVIRAYARTLATLQRYPSESYTLGSAQTCTRSPPQQPRLTRSFEVVTGELVGRA